MDLSATIATIKAIAGVAKAANNIQLYNDIIALQGNVLEQINENATLVAENAELRQQLTELRERQRTRSAMRFEQNVYWQAMDGASRVGPFCPKCLDGGEKAVRMTDRVDDHWWRCPVCDVTVEKPGLDPRANAVADWDPHGGLP